jgi:hypothetical protein
LGVSDGVVGVAASGHGGERASYEGEGREHVAAEGPLEGVLGRVAAADEGPTEDFCGEGETAEVGEVACVGRADSAELNLQRGLSSMLDTASRAVPYFVCIEHAVTRSGLQMGPFVITERRSVLAPHEAVARGSRVGHPQAALSCAATPSRASGRAELGDKEVGV